jgi:peptidoglycan-N-acetylglucosamine deacetylase
MYYFVKTPAWVKKIFPNLIWDIPTKEKILYLTFDDGPHPEATVFVLDELMKYNAKATFFCVGENVQKYPEVYRRILDEGHRVGNHTQSHLNGRKVKDDLYLKNISLASKFIDTDLFRPPYGRMTAFQKRHVSEAMGVKKAKIIMWDILSGDFDLENSAEKCLENVILEAKSGSIIVFHDSEKCLKIISNILPSILKYYAKLGFRFEKIK